MTRLERLFAYLDCPPIERLSLGIFALVVKQTSQI
jgi:hypothetical protein